MDSISLVGLLFKKQNKKSETLSQILGANTGIPGTLGRWGCSPSTAQRQRASNGDFLSYKTHSMSHANFPETNTSRPGWAISQGSLSEEDLSCCYSKSRSFSLASSSFQRKSSKHNSSGSRLPEETSIGRKDIFKATCRRTTFQACSFTENLTQMELVFYHTGSMRLPHLPCLWSQ